MVHVVRNCGKYAGDRLDIDIESTVNKIQLFFILKMHRGIESSFSIGGRRLLSCTETCT